MIRYRKRTDGLYECLEDFWYTSPRYDQQVFVKAGTVRDGASGAWDIKSSSWWVHDQLCADARWYSGDPITAWQCARVLGDILLDEGRWARARYWLWFTFLLGCKRPRENGIFKLDR